MAGKYLRGIAFLIFAGASIAAILVFANSKTNFANALGLAGLYSGVMMGVFTKLVPDLYRIEHGEPLVRTSPADAHAVNLPPSVERQMTVGPSTSKAAVLRSSTDKRQFAALVRSLASAVGEPDDISGIVERCVANPAPIKRMRDALTYWTNVVRFAERDGSLADILDDALLVSGGDQHLKIAISEWREAHAESTDQR